MRRFFVIMLSLFVSLGLVAVVVVAIGMTYFTRNLPDHQALKQYTPKITTRLYAADGQIIGEYAKEQRLFVPFDKIPPLLIKSFLAAEDADFFHHQGVSVRGLARAVALNTWSWINHQGKRQGASTITQQVAKNFLVGNEKSLERKVKEAIVAFRIEKALSKETILELYLNEIYFGLGSYGIGSASLQYFGKALNELTIDEMAFLASLPKAPSNYHPVKNHDAALARRNWVLMRMGEIGAIPPEQVLEYQKKPLLPPKSLNHTFIKAPYFAEDIRRDLVGRYGYDTLYQGGLSVRTTLNPIMQNDATLALMRGAVNYDRRVRPWQGVIANVSKTPKHCTHNAVSDDVCWSNYSHNFSDLGWRLFYVENVTKQEMTGISEEGLRLTLNRSSVAWNMKYAGNNQPFASIRSMQDIVKTGDLIFISPNKTENTAATNDNKNTDKWIVQQMPKINGAMVVLDPHTGRVYAMVGGLSFNGSEFNRATQAARQTGSSFKPFVALAAMEAGYAPNSLVLDAPIVMEILGNEQNKIWQPNNYSHDFYGLTTLRRGIELSRNLMTVRVAMSIGLKPIQDVAHRFGIYDNMPLYYSSVLGANETTVLKMTQAYAQLVNGGKRIKPSLIDRVQDRYGKTIFKHDDRECPNCINQEWSEQTEPSLPDNRKQIADPRHVYQIVSILNGVVLRGTGAKIGATFPNYALAGKTGTSNDSRDTWFIGFSPDLVVGIYFGYDQPQSLGRKETGGSVAVPVFIDFMKATLPKMPIVPFHQPAGIRLVSTDLRYGNIVSPETGGSIVEALIPGQDLQQKRVEIPGDSGGNSGDNEQSTPEGVDGIY